MARLNPCRRRARDPGKRHSGVTIGRVACANPSNAGGPALLSHRRYASQSSGISRGLQPREVERERPAGCRPEALDATLCRDAVPSDEDRDVVLRSTAYGQVDQLATLLLRILHLTQHVSYLRIVQQLGQGLGGEDHHVAVQ